MQCDAPAEPNPSSALGPAAALAHRRVPSDHARRAARHWWDNDADNYLRDHGADIGDVDFLWCPEGLRESQAQLLGPPQGLRAKTILEMGCGSAPVSRWLRTAGAHSVGFDLSMGMLKHAREINERTAITVPLVQADACRFPFRSASFDMVISAFGAVAFIAEPDQVMMEAARVLRPGGQLVFSTNHPMRWVFPDSPQARDLTVQTSYFDTNDYVEVDDHDRPTYVETHRTMGQRIRDLVAAGLIIDDVIEPPWSAGRDVVWGQWSAERGSLVPGTVIFSAHKPS